MFWGVVCPSLGLFFCSRLVFGGRVACLSEGQKNRNQLCTKKSWLEIEFIQVEFVKSCLCWRAHERLYPFHMGWFVMDDLGFVFCLSLSHFFVLNLSTLGLQLMIHIFFWEFDVSGTGRMIEFVLDPGALSSRLSSLLLDFPCVRQTRMLGLCCVSKVAFLGRRTAPKINLWTHQPVWSCSRRPLFLRHKARHFFWEMSKGLTWARFGETDCRASFAQRKLCCLPGRVKNMFDRKETRKCSALSLH